MRDPLPLDNWRSRWMQFDGRRAESMHRLASVTWELGLEEIAGEGTTVCGRSGRLVMPGIFSRMWASRCALCCKALGIPPGNGAPRNAFTREMKDA